MTKPGSLRLGARHAGQAVLAVALMLAVGAWSTARPARTETATGGWGKASTLRLAPGLAGSSFAAISCTSPGNCVGAGPAIGFGVFTAWLVSQRNGVWGKAQAIRGLAPSPGAKPNSVVNALSCPSAGNCVAVGTYRAKSFHTEGFIVTQRHGAWGKATAVPGLATLNKTLAGLTGVSCPSVGNCGATGFYGTKNKTRRVVPFLVSEVHGVWGRPVAAPGIAALPGEVSGQGVGIGPISCPTPGNCGAIGTYPISQRFGSTGGFVINQVRGTWGRAIPISGLSALNQGHQASLNAVSCPAPGSCGAVGTYTEAHGAIQVFTVSEVRGTWDKAIEIPGTDKLNSGGLSQFVSISCSSPGNCDAGGDFSGGATNQNDDSHAFVASQVHGTWDKATEIPGLAQLDKADQSAVTSISCSSPGNCGAGGFYASVVIQGHPHNQAFVVNQVHGVWTKPIEVPGTGELNTAGTADVRAISCSATNRCSAGGSYLSKKSGQQTFVASQP